MSLNYKMDVRLLLSFFLIINIVNCLNNETKTVCEDEFKYPKKNYTTKSALKNICNSKRCIVKCCVGIGKFMFVDLLNGKTSCTNKTILQNTLNKTVDLNYTIDAFEGSSEADAQLVKRNLMDYHIVHNSKMANRTCVSPIVTEPQSLFIYGNDSLVAVRFNYYKIFIYYWSFGDFCFEHILVRNPDGSFREPFIGYRFLLDQNEEEAQVERSTEIHKIITLFCSCICLLLVLIVYGLIPELRNLNGMVLMAYVSTLLTTFILRLVIILANEDRLLEPSDCKVLGIILYYAIMSAFFWMNIMSLDIWWSFRGMFKARAIHRKGEVVKFCWYALYAWGVPFLVATAVGCIEYADLSARPHFFKPHFENCFYMRIEDELYELRIYLFMPLLVLLLLNLVFFVMTAYNIWRIKRDIGRFPNKTAKYNNYANRFGVYVKLSLVMGVSWIFETVTMPPVLEMIAATYNGLTGVAIFFIFVFKWNILEKLCKRPPKELFISIHRPSTSKSRSMGDGGLPQGHATSSV